MPLTTPSAKLSANTLVQKRYASSQPCACNRSPPAAEAFSQRQRKNSSNQPMPMLIVGNRMWNVMLAANCMRARIRASIVLLLLLAAGDDLDAVGELEQALHLRAHLHQLGERGCVQTLHVVEPG